MAWPNILKAIELYPDYVDLHYCKAIILEKKRGYKEAIDTLNTCLSLGDHSQKYVVLKGSGSFLAEQLKEQCLKQLHYDM